MPSRGLHPMEGAPEMVPRFERHKKQLSAGGPDHSLSWGDEPAGVVRATARHLATPFPEPDPSCTYLAGLLCDVEPKNAESIASRSDLDRQVIQRFLGEVNWDHEPLIG